MTDPQPLSLEELAAIRARFPEGEPFFKGGLVEDICRLLATIRALHAKVAELEAALAGEREACAQIADMFADVNITAAGDSALLDPLLSGGPFTPENIEKANALMIDGCVHSSMYHAAQNIAEAIRARGQGQAQRGEG